MNFATTHFKPRSYVKISDTVVSGVPRSASSSCAIKYLAIIVDYSPYTFNILRCSVYCRLSRMWVTFNRFSIIFEEFVPHVYLCSTHGIIFERLLKLSHFECDSHTVHMLTQWRLQHPLTSTVKLSLLTHVHSSPLSLAARLHQCPANHSCYINNDRTFPGQTLYFSITCV